METERIKKEKIEEFLENHNLEEELMNDESFVQESEKLFKEHGLEFSKEQLREIIGDINDSLENAQKLPESELESIVGGADSQETTLLHPEGKPSKSSQALGIAVRASFTILGALTLGGIGLALSTEFTYDNKNNTLESTKFRTLPAVMGAGAGSIIGFKLGKLITDKYHLN